MDINEFRDLGRVAYITGNVQEALAAWQALEKVVEIANSAQQLKAEIAALANDLQVHCKDRSYVLLDRFIERMRQLSAVA
jgi:hypothetical protein